MAKQEQRRPVVRTADEMVGAIEKGQTPSYNHQDRNLRDISVFTDAHVRLQEKVVVALQEHLDSIEGIPLFGEADRKRFVSKLRGMLDSMGQLRIQLRKQEVRRGGRKAGGRQNWPKRGIRGTSRTSSRDSRPYSWNSRRALLTARRISLITGQTFLPQLADRPREPPVAYRLSSSCFCSALKRYRLDVFSHTLPRDAGKRNEFWNAQRLNAVGKGRVDHLGHRGIIVNAAVPLTRDLRTHPTPTAPGTRTARHTRGRWSCPSRRLRSLAGQ